MGRIYKSVSLEETERIAAELAGTLKSGDVLAFRGSMGAGKTAFIRSVAKYFGAEDQVSSPTFAIMNEYDGDMFLHHYDMYRISGWDELYSTGFFDDIESGGKLILIEWSENIEEYLPENVINVNIFFGEDEDSRIIEIE